MRVLFWFSRPNVQRDVSFRFVSYDDFQEVLLAVRFYYNEPETKWRGTLSVLSTNRATPENVFPRGERSTSPLRSLRLRRSSISWKYPLDRANISMRFNASAASHFTKYFKVVCKSFAKKSRKILTNEYLLLIWVFSLDKATNKITIRDASNNQLEYYNAFFVACSLTEIRLLYFWWF